MGGDSYIANSQETLRGHRGHSCDFQGIKLRLQLCQDLLDCPAYHLFSVNTEDSHFCFTSQPDAQGSVSNRSASGKSVPSLIRMVPALIVSGIEVLTG